MPPEELHTEQQKVYQFTHVRINGNVIIIELLCLGRFIFIVDACIELTQ